MRNLDTEELKLVYGGGKSGCGGGSKGGSGSNGVGGCPAEREAAGAVAFVASAATPAP